MVEYRRDFDAKWPRKPSMSPHRPQPRYGPSANLTVQRPASDGEPIDLMFVPELAEFADAIEHGRSPAITASDARRVLRVLDAVAESGRTRQVAVLGVPMLAAYEPHINRARSTPGGRK